MAVEFTVVEQKISFFCKKNLHIKREKMMDFTSF